MKNQFEKEVQFKYVPLVLKRAQIIGVLGVFISIIGVGQDIHFSQFTMAPLQINPALTGVFPGDQEVILNYKNQWQFIGAPYRTYALSADGGFLKKKWPNAYLGAGLFTFSDIAGDVKWGTTQINLSASGIVRISEHHKISAGLQGGFVQRNIKGSDLKWGSQFVNGEYSNANPGETNSFASVSYGDYSTGLSWNYAMNARTMSSNDNILATAGFAYHHLNKPKLAFYLTEQDRLYARLIAHANLHIGIKNTNFGLRPAFLFTQQGKQKDILTGMLIRYRLNENSKYTGRIKESAISFGGNYRIKDAFVPMMYFEYSSFGVGISYDVTISGLTSNNSGRGGMEISIRYINPNPFEGKADNAMF